MLSSCYSYVGHRGGKQVVSLARRGCLYHNTVQHELLHALGFNHEQTRSDRDNHIKVLLQNVESGKKSLLLVMALQTSEPVYHRQENKD